ncbi:MAG: hypothetical protein KF870_10715 [Leadbetterella sp.]|nr:hypothetical protein [Leadbetterella sp.]
MKRVIYLLLLCVIASSCKNEATPPKPEVQVVKCKPGNPALYGELSGVLLKAERRIGEDYFVLEPLSQSREGIQFTEPQLQNMLPHLFLTCNIPQSFLKNGQILKISGKGYIEVETMNNARLAYANDSTVRAYMPHPKIFLDYTQIEVVTQ